MSLKNNTIPIDTNIVSDSDIYNHNISELISDINNLYSKLYIVEQKTNQDILSYDEYFKNAEYIIYNMKNKIDSLKSIVINKKFSDFITIDFSYFAKKPIYDIKTNKNYTESSYIKNETESKSLTSNLVSSNDIEIKDIRFSSYTYVKEKLYIDNNMYNFYYISNSSESDTANLYIDLKNESTINNITINGIGPSPFDIESISYGTYNSSGSISYSTLQNTKYNNIIGITSLNIPSIQCDSIRITIKISHIKYTNMLISDSDNLYNIYRDIYGSYDSRFKYFIYHIGIKDIYVKNNIYINSGVFMSNTHSKIYPKYISLSVDNNFYSDQASIEYYINMSNINSNGFNIDSITLPILKSDITTISNEVIYPMDPSVFTDITEYNGNTIYYIAKLQFTVDSNQSISININGSQYNDPYEVVGNLVYFYSSNTINESDIFTINYTPYHINKDYMTPSIDPFKSLSKTIEYKFNIDNIVYINIQNNGLNDYTITEVSSGGTKYIKYILPYNILESNTSIHRYIDEEEDTNAPVLNIEDPNKNVFIVGRSLYVPLDTDSYPKLNNASYKIETIIKDAGIIDDIAYYYNKDNSLYINYDAIKMSDYDHTNISMHIIHRKNDIQNYINIKNINILVE